MVDAVPDNDESTAPVDDTLEATPEPKVVEKVKEKFFVVKSLTAEDLERSVQSGIWATQAHNEAALNAAYQVNLYFCPQTAPLLVLTPSLGCRECISHIFSQQVRRILWLRENGISH